ncbi:MAG: hypothetical protein GY847_36395 [Proteobacteria bacterium]|nr:hypothetical protein [Pseudomonadota bacterium]
MKKKNDSPFLGGLPLKTAWTVIWFVTLGAATLTGYHWLGDRKAEPTSKDDDVSAALVHTGPLPGALAPAPEISLSNYERAAAESIPYRNAVTIKPHQPIEDPDGKALCSFYRALALLGHGTSKSPVRILHYGDSILTTDQLSGRVRRILQQRFGDGGHGFILLGKPWRWYNHLDVKHGARGKWRARPVTSDPVSDGMYGLGGVAFETRHPNAVAWAGTVDNGPFGTRVASFDISYLAQPRGGSFDLVVDGKVIETVSTAATTRHVEHHRVEVSPGPAKLLVKTRGNGPIRLFGAVMESDRPGVVYDSLAINGARASILVRFDSEHWKSELKHRNADLVVLMFGANEGHNEFLPLNEYRTYLSQVLDTVRNGAPEASCLIVGPLDQARRKENGKLGSRRMPSKLSRTQREVSEKQGCAFFDTYTAMGGKNSMAKWFRRGLGGGDLIHPTEHGARRIGSWLADALLAGYESFLYGDKQCASSVTSL